MYTCNISALCSTNSDATEPQHYGSPCVYKPRMVCLTIYMCSICIFHANDQLFRDGYVARLAPPQYVHAHCMYLRKRSPQKVRVLCVRDHREDIVTEVK